MAGSASEEEYGASDSGPHATIQSRQPQRREADIEERRRQNRDAAARHRQRQQHRLEDLTLKEAILKQQVGELELEVESLKRSRAGLSPPQRDPFTASVLNMLEDVNSLRISLLKCCDDSQKLIDEEHDKSTTAHMLAKTHDADTARDRRSSGSRVTRSTNDRDDNTTRSRTTKDEPTDSEDIEDTDMDEGDDEHDSDNAWQGRALVTTSAPTSTILPGFDAGITLDARLPLVPTSAGSSTPMSNSRSQEPKRPNSPRTARRIRNREAATRMRSRQKQHMAELEKRKETLERRAAQLEEELRMVQRQNNPLNSSIEMLSEMIDDLSQVEYTMLSGIEECRVLLQGLEGLYKQRLP
ncbi:hypothetical protein IW148_004634 [Coemansia sp. RSA 1199]|nr:hypothetical protein IW148_004634 [Coemansia sp. RSA 1199]